MRAIAGTSPWADAPFFEDTIEPLRRSRDHDFALAALCEDGCGNIDLDWNGVNDTVRTRQDVQNCHPRPLGELDAASATTDSEILSDEALTGSDLGFSVLEVRQRLQVGEHAGSFDCAETIVRRHTPNVWGEVRRHVSWFAEALAPARARQP